MEEAAKLATYIEQIEALSRQVHFMHGLHNVNYAKYQKEIETLTKDRDHWRDMYLIASRRPIWTAIKYKLGIYT